MTLRCLPLVHLAIACFAYAAIAAPPIANASDSGRYVDRNYGFSFSQPRFTPSEEANLATVPVTLAGPPVDGFASSVNVIVQNIETTLDAYEQQQINEMTAMGWQVIEQSRIDLAGSPALRTHARGMLGVLEVEFLAVAIIQDGKRAYVLTCTASRMQFPAYEAEFDRVASSFELGP